MTYLTSAHVRRKGQTAGIRGQAVCNAGAETYRRIKRFPRADP